MFTPLDGCDAWSSKAYAGSSAFNSPPEQGRELGHDFHGRLEVVAWIRPKRGNVMSPIPARLYTIIGILTLGTLSSLSFQYCLLLVPFSRYKKKNQNRGTLCPLSLHAVDSRHTRLPSLARLMYSVSLRTPDQANSKNTP
jgi:hypothetical protein